MAPHRSIYLNVWFPLSGSVGVRTTNVVLLKEVCHREWTLRFTPGSLPSLRLQLSDQM